MLDSLRRARAVARKEIRQLLRDKLTFGMIVGIPLLQVILFGYAINTDVRHLPAAVADMAGTQLSRSVVSEAEASQVVDVVAVVHSAPELEALLRDGKVSVGLYLPPDFDRRAQTQAEPAAQLMVDGSDPTLLGVAQGLARMPLVGRGAPRSQPAALFEVRDFYNPERRSAVDIVPALIGVILTLTMVLFTAVAIVRERERGNLELLITTPVSTVELMTGKIVPYIIIGLIQVSIVLLLGWVLFHVPVVGSIATLYLSALLFIAASLGLGLLISTFAKTQFQAMQLTVFTFLPSILLSGFMFPFDGMPAFARWIGELLPLTHFIRLVRGVLLRGAGLGGMWVDVWPLLLFFAVTMFLAVLKFHKRLD
ncbi:MAG TPA: ABC transporter permease [Gammaproteobacteria bacterium]|nr:ABC transporter permease [Gammaproteobacteria bacterium]